MNGEPYIAFEDSHGLLYCGDVRAALALMPVNSVQMVCTSPPYWGLRAYGTDPQIWGGDPDCDHGEAIADEVSTALEALWQPTPIVPPMTGGSGPTSAKQVSNAGSQFGNAWLEEETRGRIRNTNEYDTSGLHGIQAPAYRDSMLAKTHTAGIRSATCTRCGAWRGELGSEVIHDCAGWATGAPCGACFICHLVEVFRGVRRVLRADGVVFCNLGDSYAGSGKGPTGWNGIGDQEQRQGFSTSKGARIGSEHGESGHTSGVTPPPGLKAKDLCGIPWRFALAMQADGWYLRGDYIWSKPNPMPESVTDRCTRSHEYIFHFSKSDRYFWDADAIREAHSMTSWTATSDAAGENTSAVREHARFAQKLYNPAGRNARSVWNIATEPSGSHKITKRVSVAPGDVDDDTQRIVSPDCPVHANRPVAIGGHGEPLADPGSHTQHSGSYRAQSQPGVGLPTAGLFSEASALGPSPAPAATSHSTPLSRTAPHAATNPAYIASAETPADTADTLGSRDDELPHHDTPASNTAGGSSVCAQGRVAETCPGTADTQTMVQAEPLTSADARYIEPHMSENRTTSADDDYRAGIQSDTTDIHACTCSYSKEIITETAHFAQFPTALVRRCIQAGTSERGACEVCGAPWERLTERIGGDTEAAERPKHLQSDKSTLSLSGNGSQEWAQRGSMRTVLGWAPTCSHPGADTVPCTVLDPFAGSGTTLVVARQLGRIGVGIELNPEYCRMAINRLPQQVLF